MSQLRSELAEKIGNGKVSDEVKFLEFFASDDSILPTQLPELVVSPTTIKEIQDILAIATKYNLSIIPSSSSEKYYGATIPTDKSIIIDLRKMNRILDINAEERYVRIEPGVTYKQLQTELKKLGLRIMVPLGFPSSASVVSTYMERVPLLSGPKILLSEGWQCILNMQIVIPNGMTVNTGSASWCKDRPSFLPTSPISGPDLSRVFSGSQGTLGIVSDLIIKAKYLPEIKRVVFIPFEKIEDIIDVIYQIQYYDKGREFLGISQKNLALVLREDGADIDKFRKSIPPWLIVMGIEADSEEKYQIDLADLKDFGAPFQEDYSVNGKNLAEIFLKEFELPDKLNNFRYFRGKCLHIPFYVNLNEISNFNQIAENLAKLYNYPLEDLYGYLMPVEQAHTCYYDFTIYYDRNDKENSEQMKQLYLELSEAIIDNGGIIDRPYGPWTKMIFSRNTAYYEFWRQVKQLIDPHEIMNPGRLKI